MYREEDVNTYSRCPRTALYSVLLCRKINSRLPRDLRLTRYGIELVKNTDTLELYHSYSYISCIRVADADEGRVKIVFIDETRLKVVCENYKELILSLNEMLAYHRTLRAINRGPSPYPEGKPVKPGQMPYSMEAILSEESSSRGGESPMSGRCSSRISTRDIVLRAPIEAPKGAGRTVSLNDLLTDTRGAAMANKVTEPVYREFFELIETSGLGLKIKAFGRRLGQEIRRLKRPINNYEATAAFAKLADSVAEFRNNTRIELIEGYKGSVSMVYTPAEIRYEITQGELAPGGGAGAGDRDLLFVIGECIDLSLFSSFSSDLLALLNAFTAGRQTLLRESFKRIWMKFEEVAKETGCEVLIRAREDGDGELASLDKIEGCSALQTFLFDLFGVDKKLRQPYPKSIAAFETLFAMYEPVSMQLTVCELVKAVSIIYDESKANASNPKGINGADDLIGVLTYCMFMADGVKAALVQAFIGTNIVNITTGRGSGDGKKLTRSVMLRDFLTRNDEGAYYSIVLETAIDALLELKL